MARTHYDVLGVPAGATAQEIRRAYLDQARVLHPDRWIDAGDKARADAERRMQEVNEAWRVLGDGARRQRYDEQIGANGDPGFGHRARSWERLDDGFLVREDGTLPPEAYVDPAARLIRALPWIALVVVLLGIFVFTAFAIDSDSGGASGCVRVGAGSGAPGLGSDSPTAVDVPCTDPGARAVVRRVAPAEECPDGTERLQTPDRPGALCLEV